MSTCQPDGLEALVRGVLGGEEAAAVRAHARECPACARELEWLRLERELVARQRPEPSPSAAEWREIERRIAGPAAPPRGPSRLHRRRSLTLAVAAAMVACLIAVLFTSRDGRPVKGDRRTSARETIGLGPRGVAVAEADSELSWWIASDRASVEQRRGNVFYRVDPAGPFVVRTPLGDVLVVGTCFRVELAAILTVTVYEGQVEVTNAAGRVELAAGEIARVEPGRAPSRVAARTGGATPPTPAQLAERERAERERIAALKAEVEALLLGQDRDARDTRPFEMSRDQLRELAAQCDLPLEMPPTFITSLGERTLEEAYAEAGYSAAEREVVERVVRRALPGHETVMRALYQELTGSPSAGESLDSETMLMEIVKKSPREDIAEANQILAEERAGIRRAPTELGGRSIVERAFRLAMTASDALARELADELPDDRVRAFRRNWARMNPGRGCPGDDAAND